MAIDLSRPPLDLSWFRQYTENMDRQVLATVIGEGSRLLSGLIRTYSVRKMQVSVPVPQAEEPEPEQEQEQKQPRQGVTTDATVRYQKREIVKELILLESHLLQGCKIDGIACDCCTKHPIKLEGLVQETAGMSPDPIFRELSDWVGRISPMTSEEASASGNYESEYSRLAMEARNFRKAIMTPDIVKEVVNEQAPSPAGEDS